MMLGITQSRTSLMPRSLTTPGGVRFLDPAHYVTQEELDRRDRRWRAMRERAWARAAAQACLSGVGVNVGRSSSSGASIASGWADDTATLVGSVRYYAAASSAIRDWGERNSVGSASRRRRQRQQQQQQQQRQSQHSLQIQRTHTGSSIFGGAASSDAGSFFSMAPSEGALVETTSLRRRPTQSSIADSTSNARDLLDEADPFSDTAGNVFRGTLAGMTGRASMQTPRSGVMMQPQARSASTAHLGRFSSSHQRHLHGGATSTRSRTQSQPFAGVSVPESGSGASIRSHGQDDTQRRGAARLLAIRTQMRRRKISEALQRLLGGVRV